MISSETVPVHILFSDKPEVTKYNHMAYDRKICVYSLQWQNII
jgi:hypothetical protein